jgi:hypothetical protein
MALCGDAAMALSFDVEAGAIVEHDQWHTQEHMPERLSIPGFLRGSRWIAEGGSPRYFVLYEVRDLAVLTGPDYLARLNSPTPWTAKLMTRYRGLRRGLCNLRASAGTGLGHALLTIHYAPAAGRERELHEWLAHHALPGMASQPGFASAHVLEAAAAAPMTSEQRIRGQDAPVRSVLLVTAYDAQFVDRVADGELAPEQFARRGAAPPVQGKFRNAYTLTAAECQRPGSFAPETAA